MSYPTIRRAALFFYLFNKKQLENIDSYFTKNANSLQTALPLNESLYNKLGLKKVFDYNGFKRYIISRNYYVTDNTVDYFIDVQKYQSWKFKINLSLFISLIVVFLLLVLQLYA